VASVDGDAADAGRSYEALIHGCAVEFGATDRRSSQAGACMAQ
jgi:hypothetical protein